jgi:hypothetical protein
MAEKSTSEKSTTEKQNSVKVSGSRRAAAKSPAETVTETAQSKQPAETQQKADRTAEEKSAQELQTTVQQPTVQSTMQQPTARQRATSAAYVPDYPTPARRPASQRPGAFNPVAWVVDGATGLLEEVRHNDLGLSEDFWKHLYAARRESLLTAQALVNSMLAITEKSVSQAKDREERRKRRGEIDVKP